MPRKILFVGHTADYTGAPRILLNLVRWFKAHSDMPFQVLLKRGGGLEAQLRDVAPVTVLSTGIPGLIGRRIRWLGFDSIVDRVERPVLRRQFAAGQVGLIYANTVANGRLLKALSFLNCPVISHVHELEMTIRDHEIGLSRFNLVKEQTSHFIAASDAVRQNLIEHHDIAEDKITLIHEFIPPSNLSDTTVQLCRTRIREQLSIPANALVVGGCGSTTKRKGPDLFVKVAAIVRQQLPGVPVYFVWVGGDKKGVRFLPLKLASEMAGLEGVVKFIGIKPNPLEFFAAFDIFALTSREDPFPLVMLEAGSLGKPIVCFEGSGGAGEFVQEDSGIVVPYLNVKAMAEAVTQLLQSCELRARLGRQAQCKVRGRFEVSVAAPQILRIIERFY